MKELLISLHTAGTGYQNNFFVQILDIVLDISVQYCSERSTHVEFTFCPCFSQFLSSSEQLHVISSVEFFGMILVVFRNSCFVMVPG